MNTAASRFTRRAASPLNRDRHVLQLFNASLGEPLILFPRSELPGPFHEIELLFRKANAVMNVVQEIETALSIINFVAMGVGCSLLPDYWRRIFGEDVVLKPLRHTPLVQTLAMISSSSTTSGAARPEIMKYGVLKCSAIDRFFIDAWI